MVGPIKKTDIPEGVMCLISPAVGRTSEGGGGGGGIPAFFTVNFPFTESRNNCYSQFKLSLGARHMNFKQPNTQEAYVACFH